MSGMSMLPIEHCFWDAEEANANSNRSPVIPAKAGIHPDCGQCKFTGWIPAFAGMTDEMLP